MTFNEWRNEHTYEKIGFALSFFIQWRPSIVRVHSFVIRHLLCWSQKVDSTSNHQKRETECVIIIIHAYHWLFARIYMKFMANWLCIVRLILSTHLLFSWAKPSWLTDSFRKAGLFIGLSSFSLVWPYVDDARSLLLLTVFSRIVCLRVTIKNHLAFQFPLKTLEAWRRKALCHRSIRWKTMILGYYENLFSLCHVTST